MTTVATVMFTACGSKPKEVAIVVPKQVIATPNCSGNTTLYKLADNPVQFCYDKKWGEPVITKLNAEVGSGEVVTFGTADNTKAPKIWLATSDYKPTNKSESVVDFKPINAFESNADIFKKQLNDAAGYNEKDVSARKADISTVRVIRADIGGKVKKIVYFVKNAFEGHNMIISGSKDIAEAVDNIVFDMAFKS